MRDDRSFIELKARQRAHALLDEGSYRELLDPFEGVMSPWLGAQGIVPQADDENFPDWGKQRFSDSEDRLWRKLAVRELLADRTFMNIGI